MRRLYLTNVTIHVLAALLWLGGMCFVIWEATQVCDLACLKCRDSARPMRDRGELTTAVAMRLMDTVRAELGHPLFALPLLARIRAGKVRGHLFVVVHIAVLILGALAARAGVLLSP